MSNKENQQLSQLGNMDQIREILFGSEIRMFEEEIKKLSSSVSTMNTEIMKRIDTLETTFRDEQKSASQASDQKIKNLSTNMQDENSDFKEQLVKNEKKFNRSIDTAKDEMETQIESLKNEQTNIKIAAKKDLESLRATLDEILNKEMSGLSEAKVSKDDFSAMLLDMAMKIKGTNLENNLESMIQEQVPSK